MSFHDLPKDMLVKLCTTIQEETRNEGKYYLIYVYYGAHYSIIQISDEEELKKELSKYIKESIEGNRDYLSGYNHLGKRYEELNFEDLKRLTKFAKELGSAMIKRELGFGMVAIIKGQLI